MPLVSNGFLQLVHESANVCRDIEDAGSVESTKEP